ncbi:hypothetical protein Tco_0820084, partial [Tanacetum coccineum]
RQVNLVSYLVPVSQKERRRRQSPVTWRPHQRLSMTGQPPVNGDQPPVDGGQWWRSTMADDPSTTVGPPPDHRSTTVGPPVNGGQRWWLTGSWAGSGWGPWAGSGREGDKPLCKFELGTLMIEAYDSSCWARA